jgi:hypothetical protein
VAAVALAGVVLTACSSSTPSPFSSSSPLPGSIISARVVADDRSYVPQSDIRPRFVPCQGLSGCARTSPTGGDAYPGVILPTGVDSQVDYGQEFVVYLVDATFDAATLDQTTVHIRVNRRERGFQMVKLDGQDVFSVFEPSFSFEDAATGKQICESKWEGCG